MAAEGFHMKPFGFEPNEEGDLEFMTVNTDFEINSFEDYQQVMHYLVQIALDNPGVMPILTFNHEAGS